MQEEDQNAAQIPMPVPYDQLEVDGMNRVHVKHFPIDE